MKWKNFNFFFQMQYVLYECLTFECLKTGRVNIALLGNF